MYEEAKKNINIQCLSKVILWSAISIIYRIYFIGLPIIYKRTLECEDFINGKNIRYKGYKICNI